MTTGSRRDLRVLILASLLIAHFSLRSLAASQISTPQKAALDGLNEKGGFSRFNWAGLFTTLVKLPTSNEAGSLGVKPTLWSLMNMGKVFTRKDTNLVDSDYARLAFLRNLELDLAITPNNAKKFTVDNLELGATYAILNDKEVTESDYESLNGILDVTDVNIGLIYQYGANQTHVCDRPYIIAFLRNHTDTLLLPKELRDSVRNRAKDGDLVEAVTGFTEMKTKLRDILAAKPLWTITFTDKLDFNQTRSGVITVSSHLGLPIRLGGDLIPLEFDLSFSAIDDTTSPSTNLDRKLGEFDFGKNFKVSDYLEINPSLVYEHVFQDPYTGEDLNNLKASITLRPKLTGGLWVPITIRYDPVHPKFFGFLSMQFSI
jgi:hypothetical protein